MYEVTLEKVKSSHNNMRTHIINGICTDLPIIGQPFVLYSNEVLTKDANLRCVKTTIVEDVTHSDDEITFTTGNSLYVLKTKL